MAEKYCYECLFCGQSYKWQSDNYCNQFEKEVDEDKPACSHFLDDSHNCCYDCDAGKDKGLFFYCSVHRKNIKNPAHFYCYHFRY